MNTPSHSCAIWDRVWTQIPPDAWREDMPRNTALVVLWSIGLAVSATPAAPANVTPERLGNTTSEPQNWLMIQHDFYTPRPSSVTPDHLDTVTSHEPQHT